MIKLLALLTLSGLCGVAVGLLRLAAEQRRRCPCGEPVSDPLGDYCPTHEWTYRAGAERGMAA